MPRVLNERARLLFVVVLFGIRLLFVLLLRSSYGVVPTGLLTFIGSLLQRSRENYFRNFGVSLRETNRQIVYFFLRKTLRPRLRM